MPVRVFHLEGDDSPTISIAQESDGTPITVTLSDRLLGTLTTPEEMRVGLEFTLDDSSILTVRVVNKQVQVWHNDLPLSPARKSGARATVDDRVTKRVMLICASIAAVILLGGIWLVVNNLYKTPNPATDICLFRCVSGPIAPVVPTGVCSYRCAVAPTTTPTPPPPVGPHPPVLPDAVLLGGWVLPTLIACFAGVRHAFVHRARRWAAFGLLPALLLEIALLVFLLPVSQIRFSQDQDLALLLLFYSIVILVPVICLIYARSLPQDA
jgi:hypothetical protein